MPEVNFFGDNQTFVCGTTQMGKTYATRKNLEKINMPVFFFNPQDEEMNFTRADKSNDVEDIIDYLYKGGKINYVPSLNNKFAKVELNCIINKFFMVNKLRDRHIKFVIDECHLMAKQGQNNEYIQMIPTRGFKFGLEGVFIAQRPALVDKTLITQCTKHIIFHTEWESEYFRTKGINVDEVSRLLGNKESDTYNYIIYERGQITGPYKEN